MAWARVQSKNNTIAASTTLTVTLTSTPITGNKIAVFTSCVNGGTVLSVKDGNNVTLTQGANAVNPTNMESDLHFYDVPASPSTTFTITASGSSNMGADVLEISGLLAGNTTACLDGTCGLANGTATPAAPTYSSTKANEFLITYFGDWGNSSTCTVPSGLTLDANSINTSANTNVCVGYGNTSGGSDPTSWSYTVTGNNWAAFTGAFKLAASGSPDTQISIPQLSNLRLLAPTPMLLAQNVAHEFGVTVAALAPIPGIIGPARRASTPRGRRGAVFATPPPAAQVAPPAWVPTAARIRRPQPAARRGEFLPLPLPQGWPPPYLDSRRRPPQSRRGEYLVVIPAPVITTPPTFVPPPVTRRRPPPATRRGDIWLIPLVGAAPTPPPPFPPPYLEQTHTRPASARRGRFLTIPLTGAAPTPPPPAIPPLLTHRPYRPLQRRGQLLPTPPPPTAPPPRLQAARRRTATGRPRGTRFLLPPYTALPAAPSVWRPPTIRATPRRPARRQARGQYLPLYMVGLPPPTYTPAYVSVDAGTSSGSLDTTTHAGTHDSGTSSGSQGHTSWAGSIDTAASISGLVE